MLVITGFCLVNVEASSLGALGILPKPSSWFRTYVICYPTRVLRMIVSMYILQYKNEFCDFSRIWLAFSGVITVVVQLSHGNLLFSVMLSILARQTQYRNQRSNRVIYDGSLTSMWVSLAGEGEIGGRMPRPGFALGEETLRYFYSIAKSSRSRTSAQTSLHSQTQ
jgi:hypothetical protein